MMHFVRFFRKPFILCLWALAIIGSISGLQLWERALTHGFTEAAILQHFPKVYEGQTTPLNKEEQAYLQALFSQPFRYLAKGAQSFVFESADHQYVFKCFKDLHYSNNTARHLLQRIPAYRNYMQDRITKRRLWDSVTIGCHLAVTKLPQETGIFYLHLAPTEAGDLPPLTLIDRRGRVVELDANQMPFYLQKKGISLKEGFTRYRAQGDLEGATKALQAVFAYLIRRSESEVLDTDPSYARNLGWIDGMGTNLDLGQLVSCSWIKEPDKLYEDLQLHLTGLREFFQKTYPEMVPLYDKEMAQLQKNLAG